MNAFIAFHVLYPMFQTMPLVVHIDTNAIKYIFENFLVNFFDLYIIT